MPFTQFTLFVDPVTLVGPFSYLKFYVKSKVWICFKNFWCKISELVNSITSIHSANLTIWFSLKFIASIMIWTWLATSSWTWKGWKWLKMIVMIMLKPKFKNVFLIYNLNSPKLSRSPDLLRWAHNNQWCLTWIAEKSIFNHDSLQHHLDENIPSLISLSSRCRKYYYVNSPSS